MTVEEKIAPLATEFTDRVLVDTVRNSILLSLKKEYFKTVFREFKKLGYRLSHATHFQDTGEMTVLFMRVTDK